MSSIYLVSYKKGEAKYPMQLGSNFMLSNTQTDGEGMQTN